MKKIVVCKTTGCEHEGVERIVTPSFTSKSGLCAWPVGVQCLACGLEVQLVRTER